MNNESIQTRLFESIPGAEEIIAAAESAEFMKRVGFVDVLPASEALERASAMTNYGADEVKKIKDQFGDSDTVLMFELLDFDSTSDAYMYTRNLDGEFSKRGLDLKDSLYPVFDVHPPYKSKKMDGDRPRMVTHYAFVPAVSTPDGSAGQREDAGKPYLTAAELEQKTGVKALDFDAKLFPEGSNQKTQARTCLFTFDRMRPLILVDVDGVNVLFYVSTGRGGKKKVAARKWYPVMGYGKRWLNKGSQEMINDYYTCPKLKEIAEKLDRFLPNMIDTTDTDDITFTGPYQVPSIHYSERSRIFAAINRDNPMVLDDAPTKKNPAQFRKWQNNVREWIHRLGGTWEPKAPAVDPKQPEQKPPAEPSSNKPEPEAPPPPPPPPGEDPKQPAPARAEPEPEKPKPDGNGRKTKNMYVGFRRKNRLPDAEVERRMEEIRRACGIASMVKTGRDEETLHGEGDGAKTFIGCLDTCRQVRRLLDEWRRSGQVPAPKQSVRDALSTNDMCIQVLIVPSESLTVSNETARKAVSRILKEMKDRGGFELDRTDLKVFAMTVDPYQAGRRVHVRAVFIPFCSLKIRG